MTNLKEKITQRMDTVQWCMETQLHIMDPTLVSDQISRVSKFWSALSDEDRDYIECARYALDEKMEWKIQ